MCVPDLRGVPPAPGSKIAAPTTAQLIGERVASIVVPVAEPDVDQRPLHTAEHALLNAEVEHRRVAEGKERAETRSEAEAIGVVLRAANVPVGLDKGLELDQEDREGAAQIEVSVDRALQEFVTPVELGGLTPDRIRACPHRPGERIGDDSHTVDAIEAHAGPEPHLIE